MSILSFEHDAWRSELAKILADELAAVSPSIQGVIRAIAINCTPWNANAISLSIATDADDPISTEEWDLADT